MFWPRWAAKYTFLVTRGETSATSKIVMAGDLWGGMPMLKEVTRESQSILRDNQYANRSKRDKGEE